MNHYIKKKKPNNDYVYTVYYKGITADICIDDYGQQYYAQFPNKEHDEVCFGAYNFGWIYDLKYIIDEEILKTGEDNANDEM